MISTEAELKILGRSRLFTLHIIIFFRYHSYEFASGAGAARIVSWREKNMMIEAAPLNAAARHQVFKQPMIESCLISSSRKPQTYTNKLEGASVKHLVISICL